MVVVERRLRATVYTVCSVNDQTGSVGGACKGMKGTGLRCKSLGWSGGLAG